MKELSDANLHAIENAHDCGRLSLVMNYSKEFTNWPLENNDELRLACLMAAGSTLEELLASAVISLEDWHGNEGPRWGVGDLHAKDYERVEELLKGCLGE